jgi:hypothetical protein
MSGADVKGLDSKKVWEKYLELDRNISATARHFKITRPTVLYHLRKMPGFGKPVIGGKVHGTRAVKAAPSGAVRRYILTSAQNNTLVPEKLWENLMALKEFYQAELMIGTFTYNKNAYGPMSVKWGTDDAPEELWYDERLLPYIRDERVELAKGLVWCGEMNILPTAVRPLSELHTYTGMDSGIFPHAKIALKCVATAKSEPPKFNYTTGACTMRNYIKKLAGLRAEFHHTYGALLVEVDVDGVWFVRQLNADSKWRIHDLDVVAEGGVVQTDVDVEGMVWGDVHTPRTDDQLIEVCWGSGGILDELRPRHQVFHDLLDFYGRNHHEVKNHVKMFKRYVNGQDSVVDEIRAAAAFLDKAYRPWCTSVVVNSNHDRALERWVVDADYKKDPKNALFYLRATAAWYEAIAKGDTNFLLLEWVMEEAGLVNDTRFLRLDESYTILDIEHGFHGDLGPNGTKGDARSLSHMGRKLTMADKHTAEIHDGVYVAGTSSRLDMGYNHGPSSWSHSHVVLYRNGKRAIITMRDGRWRVPRS